jgi:Domain of unknown function (DUF3291)
MPDFELAEINIARLVAPLDDPQIADFVADLDRINALADASEGFIWRLKSEGGDATEIPYNDDPFVILNMSVWTSPQTLRDFTYRSGHVEVYRKRQSWFHRPDKASYCLWWVPAGHRPTVAEARDRLEHYRKHGATEHAFWFNQLFPAPTVVLA